MTNYADLAKKHLTEWMNNPYWAGYYRDAPSQRCKDYIALELLYNDLEEDELADEMERMEAQLDLADWKHLLRFSACTPERGKIINRIRELEPEEG